MNEQTANEVKGLIQENQGTIIINFGAPVDSARQPPTVPPAETSKKDFLNHNLGELLSKSLLKIRQKKIKDEIERDKKIKRLEKSHQEELEIITQLKNELQSTRLELAQALQLLKNFTQRENFKGL
jgi:hypothetical protein